MKRLLIVPGLLLVSGILANQALAANALVDNGGGKMGAHRVHVIWWNAKPFSSSYQRSVHSLFQDVARDSGKKTNLYSVLAEYNITYQVNWGGSSSGNVPIPRGICPKNIANPCAGRNQLDALLKQQIAAKNWTSSLEDFYMVMLPRGLNLCVKGAAGTICNGDYWAGIHSTTWDGSKPIIWGVVEYNPSMNGVDNFSTYNPGLAYIIFHEHLEAITDPFGGSGWATAARQEIADLCEGSHWQTQKIGMHSYTVPPLWSNRLRRCTTKS